MLQLFGTINNPFTQLGGGYGDLTAGNGPVSLLSNIFRLVAVTAGFWALMNLVIAGYQFIYGQGDPSSVESAQKKMTMSLIGLIVIVMSYAIAAIIGQFLFGRSDFIFRPQIFGPGTI